MFSKITRGILTSWRFSLFIATCIVLIASSFFILLNQRSTISPSLATASQQSSVMSQAKASNASQLHQKNELSSIGREIMMNVPQHMSQAPSQQQPSPAFGSNNRAGPLAAEIPP